MWFHAQVRALGIAGALFLLLSFSSLSWAECSDAKVKRLSKQGKTVASIARTCDMGKDEIQSLLEDEEAPEPEDKPTRARPGLPSGAPVGQCGCWGYAEAGARQPHPRCRSGFATPSMCPAMCPAGGYAWRGVCA